MIMEKMTKATTHNDREIESYRNKNFNKPDRATMRPDCVTLSLCEFEAEHN